ncbi:MAG: twin-arginine translocase subunit TatC [Verrucomicrobiota bacterium]
MSTDAEPTPEPGLLSSFWTHVEELRRAIIRSAIAIAIAFVVCFACGKEIVGVLDYPLRNIDIFTKPAPTVTFELGKSKFGPYDVTREEFPALPPGDAPHAVFKFGTKLVDGEQVITLRLDPDADAGQSLRVRLSNLTPNEGFFVGFRLAIYAALVVSSPFWIYFMGSFILPAFHLHERKVIFGWMGWSVFLFLLGVVSTYCLLLPVALRASLEYSHWLGFEATFWRADSYVNFVCIFMLGMGLGFQFPLVVLFLVKIGLVNHRQLASCRRYVIVLSFIMGALLTTPEVITQVAMAVPLCLLYELCIWIAWYWDWKKRRASGVIET